MKRINLTIDEKRKNYPVYIGSGLLQKINELIELKKYSQIAVVTDKNLEKHWLNILTDSIDLKVKTIVLNPGENEKTLENVTKIWGELFKEKFDRKSLVINLGGGVIGDMGGFAASTYMRGIDFLQIPTTITAQVDAMVGGKLGINFKHYKNYIGVFNQPIGVIMDIQTLNTLPEREYLEGFGEIIKHGLIYDKKYFDIVTSKKPREFKQEELAEIIAGSVEIKKEVVEKDEKENNTRKILNFGHTIGHALESLSLETSDPLLHGEAILMGMIAETRISELSGRLDHKKAEEIIKKLSKTGLPTTISNIPINAILEKTEYDKKNNYGEVNWTLIDKIGHAVIDQHVEQSLVKQSLKEIVK